MGKYVGRAGFILYVSPHWDSYWLAICYLPKSLPTACGLTGNKRARDNGRMLLIAYSKYPWYLSSRCVSSPLVKSSILADCTNNVQTHCWTELGSSFHGAQVVMTESDLVLQCDNVERIDNIFRTEAAVICLLMFMKPAGSVPFDTLFMWRDNWSWDFSTCNLNSSSYNQNFNYRLLGVIPLYSPLMVMWCHLSLNRPSTF